MLKLPWLVMLLKFAVALTFVVAAAALIRTVLTVRCGVPLSPPLIVNDPLFVNVPPGGACSVTECVDAPASVIEPLLAKTLPMLNVNGPVAGRISRFIPLGALPLSDPLMPLKRKVPFEPFEPFGTAPPTFSVDDPPIVTVPAIVPPR